MKSEEVLARILGRYKADRGWSVMSEVSAPPQRGQPQRRYDAVALSLWGSMGVEVHGFEIKVSLADWTAEKLNPAKSAPLSQYCDYWWVVAPREVVDPRTAPPGWGVLSVVGKGLRMAVKAPRREPVRGEVFWQCMLNRMSARSDRDQARLLQQARRDGAADAASAARHRQDQERDVDLRAQVARFEELTGIKIREFEGSGERAAAAMKLFQEQKHVRVLRNTENAVDNLTRALEYAQAVRKALA